MGGNEVEDRYSGSIVFESKGESLKSISFINVDYNNAETMESISLYKFATPRISFHSWKSPNEVRPMIIERTQQVSKKVFMQ